jgi:N-acetylmuramic acid 6-phosphate etherase
VYLKKNIHLCFVNLQAMNKTTESSSKYDHLEKMSTAELLYNINQEDQTVAKVVAGLLPEIEKLVDAITSKMASGGRLFYIGAGTSGRLGIVDASECPPTFGIPHDIVIGLMAGGDKAIRKAVEFAEDDIYQGWQDLEHYGIDQNDVLVGIAASGTTPYVIGALENAQKNGITTGCVVCNSGSPMAKHADFAIEAVVGPEFVTGSTRMKAGTAQKMILNMISTAVMIKLGRVKGNKMVDMQLSNDKLVIRGTQMVMQALNISESEARKKLLAAGNVRKAIEGDFS